MKIAIVEDEPKLARVLVAYLQREGFETALFEDGALALESLTSHPVDLVLLDLMLPGLDGMSVCRELRKTSNTPVIMLTARVEEIDRLLGLELGADDYICKPYSPREVVARVKAVLRRTAAVVAVPSATGFKLDADTARVSIGEQSVPLTLVELRLLQTLSERPGHIFSRAQLMSRIYQDNRVVSDRTIDSHVKKLRAKLRSLGDGDSGAEDCVQSVYGIGYRFEVPV